MQSGKLFKNSLSAGSMILAELPGSGSARRGSGVRLSDSHRNCDSVSVGAVYLLGMNNLRSRVYELSLVQVRGG